MTEQLNVFQGVSNDSLSPTSQGRPQESNRRLRSVRKRLQYQSWIKAAHQIHAQGDNLKWFGRLYRVREP